MDLLQGLHAIVGVSSNDILWWQMCIRAILIFLFGLIALRLFGRRAFGKQTPLDIVTGIVIGSNLSRAMTANAPFLPTLAATGLLMILFWLLAHAAARSHALGWLVKGSAIALLQDGRCDTRAMKRAAVSNGDIEEAARTSGLPGLTQVKQAFLERSGTISTISGS